MTILEEAVTLFNQLDDNQKLKEIARLSTLEMFDRLTEENKAKVIAKINELISKQQTKEE